MGQVAVGDGGVEDQPEQCPVGADAAGGEPIGGQGVRPAADLVGVDLVERKVAEDGQNARIDLGLDGAGRARVREVPGWPPHLGGVGAEQGGGANGLSGQEWTEWHCVDGSRKTSARNKPGMLPGWLWARTTKMPEGCCWHPLAMADPDMQA